MPDAPAQADGWKYLPPPTSCSQVRTPPGRTSFVFQQAWQKSGLAFMEGQWQYECARTRQGAKLAVYQYNYGAIWTACYVSGVPCQGPPPVFRAR